MNGPWVEADGSEELLLVGWKGGRRGPIVALHGFTGHGRGWGPLGQAWADRGGLFWAPTLPGHDPRSPTRPGEGFVEVARRLGRCLEQRLDGACRLVGYSMGARLALVLALERPELVRDLLLVGVHPGLEDDLRRRRRRIEQRWQRQIEEQGLLAFLSWWENRPLFASQSRLPAVRRREQNLERRRHRGTALARALDCLGLGVMPACLPRLGSLKLPIHLAVGEDDPKFVALGRQIVRTTCGRATLEIVPGAGHNLRIEQPERLLRWMENSP